MTRYVIDAGVAIHLVTERIEVHPSHRLVAPALLRSQVLSRLHEAVRAGELSAIEGRTRLTHFGELSIRLLGDAVLRRRAWELADRLGRASTFDAEYLAVTQLQADAFVTLDAELARQAEGIVPLASVEDLSRP